MKKIITLGIVILSIITTSFTTENTETRSDEKTCTVYVKWYSTSGKPAKGIKVVGYTDKHALSTEGTQTAYTDSNGKVKLKWNSYRDLYILYVDGTGHKGTYKDGGSYTFAID